MLLSAIVAGGATPAPLPPQVIDPEPASVPYAVGATLWDLNPPIPCSMDHPTPEGGVAHDTASYYVHPSVLDFHDLTPTGDFAGFRYWMANSQYLTATEESWILCSNDGYDWVQHPQGRVGALWLVSEQPPPSDGTTQSSDPELIYDAANGSLVTLWRQNKLPVGYLWHSKTSDGITWTTPLLIWERDLSTFTSPSVFPDGSGGWVLISFGGNSHKYTAPALTGPWTDQGTTNLSGWHGGIWRDPATGVIYAIGDGRAQKSSDGGTTWTRHRTVIVRKKAWEVRGIYRITLQPHPNGTHFRMWYSTNGFPGTDCRIGYTIAPRTHWE